MLIEYKATIRPSFDIREGVRITLDVNGYGKDERACKTDAQRQVRAYIKHLKYDLELRTTPA